MPLDIGAWPTGMHADVKAVGKGKRDGGSLPKSTSSLAGSLPSL